MDSISQFLWGALTAEAIPNSKPRPKIPPWLIGGIAGTMPDLDSFLRSSTDPLFDVLMHRHFTHSIFFIPFGALVTWLLLFYFFRKEKGLYLHYYLLCFAAYGTHWILDVMTSYGTQILWPISNHRFALDWLSIVDPALTLPWLVVFISILFIKQKTKWARLILIYSCLYFAWAGKQHHNGLTALTQLTKKIYSITPERVRLLPTLGNSFWFRGIVLAENRIYATGILVKLNGNIYYREGTNVEHISLDTLSKLSPEAYRQIKIWDWFTDSWMFKATNNNTLTLGDGRYTATPTDFDTLWALAPNFENPTLTTRSRPDFKTGERSPLEWFHLIIDSSKLERWSDKINPASQ